MEEVNAAELNEESSFQEKGKFNSNRLVLGGTFGISLGNSTTINISPQIGYALTNSFVVGGGVSYNYYNYNRYDLSLSYLGLNAYVRFHPIQYITLQIQPEVYGRWGKEDGYSIDGKVVPAVLIGAGALIPVTYNSGLSLMLYYDIVQDDWSPYGNQVFYSIGYTFRF